MKDVRDDQRRLWGRWSGELSACPAPERYGAAYDEINAFLRDHGDPALNRATDGTIYGGSGAPGDWEKRLIVALVADGTRVLEIGCGDGRVAMAVAAAGAEVRALDASAVAVATATRLAAEQGVNVQFAVGNAVTLDEPDCSYDYVMSCDMIEHLHPDHVPLHLAETRRVLKPGGAYVMSLPHGEAGGVDPDPLHLGCYASTQFWQMLEATGFRVTSAALEFLRRTGDLNAVIGPATTRKARLGRRLAALPLVGGAITARLVRRWTSELNFFCARKPAAAD